jgi:GT2 family glycosyltransferase
VTFNGSKYISKCIDSLKNSQNLVHIIVIDNNSTDNTAKIVRENYNNVELISLPTNLGFGKANNIGLKKALHQNADYVFLLNQDAWLATNTIKVLIDIHKKYQKYAILSPVHFAGDEQYLDNNFTNYIVQSRCNGFLSDLFNDKDNMKDIYEIDFVNAAFWLLSKECLQNIGGFDPLFEHYGEDDDYVYRVKFHNYKIALCPKVYGYHARNQDVLNHKSSSLEKEKYNYLLLWLKNSSFPDIKRNDLRIKMLGKKFLRALVWKSDTISAEISAISKILKNYRKIIKHKQICEIKGTNFLE